MKTHGYFKRFLALFLLLAVGFTAIQPMQPANASKISKAKKERRRAKEALRVEKRLMKKVTAKRQKLEKEIESVDKDLVAIMVDIQITRDDIGDKKKEITKLAKKQTKTEQEVEDQKEAIKKQVKFMYENSAREIADVVFKAKSISSLLNSVEYYNDIYDYGENLLDNYKDTLQLVTDLKEEAKSEKAELIAIKETYQEQKAELKKLKEKKKKKLKNYKQQLRKAKKLSVKYRSTIRKQNKIIRKEIARIKAERKAERERLAREAAAAAQAAREQAAAAQAAAQAERDLAEVVTSDSGGSAEAQAVLNTTNEFFQGEGTSMQQSFDELATLMKLCEIDDIPMLKGCTAPLADEKEMPDSEGVRLIIEEAMKTDDRPLYILLQGNLTDLAAALNREPEIADRLTAVWIGGGAYPDGGSEFNIMQDVHAARVIFSSDVKLWQIPANAYSEVEVSFSELALKVKPCGKVGQYLFQQLMEMNEILSQFQGIGRKGENWCLGDQPTAAVLLQSEDRGNYHTEKAPVIGDDFKYSPNPDGKEIRVYDHVDVRMLLDDFYAKLALCFGSFR